MGRDCSVGIATRYGLDGPGIQSLRVRFSAPVQTGPGAHPASYTMGTRSFPWVKGLKHGIDHPPPSSAEIKERVEPYVYSNSRPSWPVIGWTLPLPLHWYHWTWSVDKYHYSSQRVFILTFQYLSLFSDSRSFTNLEPPCQLDLIQTHWQKRRAAETAEYFKFVSQCNIHRSKMSASKFCSWFLHSHWSFYNNTFHITKSVEGEQKPPSHRPSLRLAQAIVKPNIFLYKYTNNHILVILPAYTAYEDGTECSETLAHKVQTPGNYPKERIKKKALCTCTHAHTHTHTQKQCLKHIMCSVSYI